MSKKNESPSIMIKYLAVAILVVLGVFAVKAVVGGGSLLPSGSGNNAPAPSAANNPAPSGSVQEVQITMDNNYRYQPDPVRLKKGVPVRFIVDMNSVTGCMRSIQIPGLGVAKYVKPGDNAIEFTPAKAGTFSMHCSMNMGQGTVIVEDTDGSVPTTLEAQAAAPVPAAGGCGMAAGGGCGCGGGRTA